MGQTTNHEEKWGNLEADVFMMRQAAKRGTGNLHFDNDSRNRDRIDAHKALERMGFTETKVEGGMFYVKFVGDAWVSVAE